MCFRSRSRGLLASILLLAACGCAHRPERRFERLAVVRFENLTGDPAQDWAAAAVSMVTASQLAGSPRFKVLELSAVRDLSGSGATLALQGYISIESGRFAAHASLEDLRSGHALKSVTASDSVSGGPLPVADTLARSIDDGARRFGTRNTAALHAYIEGLSSSPGADSAFERAVGSDPDFGEAYAAWAQTRIAHGDRTGAERVFAAARERYGNIAPLPRAELEVLSELFDGRYASQRHALVALSRLTPADGTVFARLGTLDVSARQFASAVEWYKQALEREPENPLLLNETGYAQAFAGDLDAATATLRKYAALRPSDANPLDSLGDAHYVLGRFRDAERFYLEAHGKEPGFSGGAGELAKAAQARLMAGDPAGADGLFARYLDARRSMGDPLLEYRQAQWEILKGNSARAAVRLETLAAGSHPAAWLASVQLCALSLDSGDRERARQYAARAMAAPGGKQQALVAFCTFLAQPSASPEEWQARADKTFSSPPASGLKPTALALALLDDRQYTAAVPVLRQLYNQTPPSSPEPVGVYLGRALIESGQANEARAPLSLYPLPQPNREQPFGVPAVRQIPALRSRAGLK